MRENEYKNCLGCAADEGLEYESRCMLGFSPDRSIFGDLCPQPRTFRKLQIISEAIGLNHGNRITTE